MSRLLLVQQNASNAAKPVTPRAIAKMKMSVSAVLYLDIRNTNVESFARHACRLLKENHTLHYVPKAMLCLRTTYRLPNPRSQPSLLMCPCGKPTHFGQEHIYGHIDCRLCGKYLFRSCRNFGGKMSSPIHVGEHCPCVILSWSKEGGLELVSPPTFRCKEHQGDILAFGIPCPVCGARTDGST